MAEGEITTFSALTEKFNLPAGNYKKPKLLYCSNGGHFLRILPDGTVDGTRDRSDMHSEQSRAAAAPGPGMSPRGKGGPGENGIWAEVCMKHISRGGNTAGAGTRSRGGCDVCAVQCVDWSI